MDARRDGTVLVNAIGFAKTCRALLSVAAQVATESASELTGELQAQFDRGAGPYGDGWAALKSGAPSHLEASGAMRGGTRVRPNGGAGLAMEAPPPANFHQSGTRNMPARKVIPDNGLPASWRAILQRIYSDRLRKGFGQ